ncbi:hypothetical protein OEZ86_011462 [Tetradesmus obliquus]|uniref:Uncharacterized protein n=2 Tax=Tetradesmus obliquus TaxID=3088 RepID=A0A383WBC1_TETOB|nr:hypothetical protein OEZ85_008303 [Tetradesmus obliquus]WIA28938.1 hypothetical protein OEZ86_011462 [Tetradesmus obliquus]|eukprot:jgi/Sobl393_1/179/SZX74918.1
MASGPTKEAVERTLVVDTLAQTKKFETLGLSRDQAENLAVYLSEQIVLDRMRLSEKFTAKVELEKSMLEQDARIGGFKAELIQKQDMHLATLQKDLDRQQNYLDKIRSEVRHEIDKLSASQRLDLNLEKGRMRDDLQQMRDKTIELEIKLDREVNDIRAGMEKAKNDIIKSTIAIMGTFSAIAFTITRLMATM